MEEKQERNNPNEICLPDGTLFYSYEKAREIFDKIEKKKFSIADCILILLQTYPEKPLCGRISLMKQVFLLIKEILGEENVQDAKFVPYLYGMYSFVVTNVLTNLEFAGYIIAKGKKNSKLEEFYITKKGEEYVSKLFATIPENMQKLIKEKRKGWDQLGYDGILRLVYTKYPEFIEKSKLKERYKLIKWGRGLG